MRDRQGFSGAVLRPKRQIGTRSRMAAEMELGEQRHLPDDALRAWATLRCVSVGSGIGGSDTSSGCIARSLNHTWPEGSNAAVLTCRAARSLGVGAARRWGRNRSSSVFIDEPLRMVSSRTWTQ